MMAGLAANTWRPAKSVTRSSNVPSSRTGFGPSMPCAAHSGVVVLAERRRQVDDAGAVLGGDEVGGEHAEAPCPAAAAK